MRSSWGVGHLCAVDMLVRDMFDDLSVEQNCSLFYMTAEAYIQLLVCRVDNRRVGFSQSLNLLLALEASVPSHDFVMCSRLTGTSGFLSGTARDYELHSFSTNLSILENGFENLEQGILKVCVKLCLFHNEQTAILQVLGTPEGGFSSAKALVDCCMVMSQLHQWAPSPWIVTADMKNWTKLSGN